MVGCEGLAGLLCKKSGGEEELGVFYPIRPECQENASRTRFRLRAGKTLSPRKWHAAFCEDGHLDIAKVLTRIQRGGIHPAIKGLVWEFLLGCYGPNSTFEERNQIRQRRREQYSIWKAECKNLVPVIGSGKFITTPIITDDGQPITDSSTNNDQGVHVNNAVSDKKAIQWMLLLHQIGLDVVRTDRTLVFYESETNQAKLWDVLAVYAWVDSDIGYVQGMNDICSPMVILLENEADAFWCFDRAMKRLLSSCLCVYNREKTSGAVQVQLACKLKELDGGEYLFAFRMLMVLFRREFTFVDALYLWELMWALEYNPNMFSIYEEPSAATDKSSATLSTKELVKNCGKFERKNVKTGTSGQPTALAVFLVASVLETKNKRILNEAKGLDDVVQIVEEITGNLDAKKVCKDALKIHSKYLSKAKMP
ncbi:rab GTPase-activating protein 22 isoform X2 [Manihot esculenta]|uniref:rab GTPase-activating protein 22 isoform X2 n=1 Tax=Manihot esculenta TaxID=3983 RepID=UPI000B5D6025|nr:rab GTPase-activating protein 22 isoform X2 [Manihot esculenta]